MRTFGLLITSLLFLSFATMATEDGQAPTHKENADKVTGDKGTGTDSLVATGDSKKKQDNTKKKPSNPNPPANK